MYPRKPAQFSSIDGTTRIDGFLAEPDRYRALFDRQENGALVARGAGLSYVAAGAGAGITSVGMRYFNRILDFDPATGVVEAEAGITLGALLGFLLPRGFMLPVMPGHPAISLGGCIAADVHGKNPARDGTFRDHLMSLDLWHPQLGLRRGEAGSPVFDAGCGGYGLTGIIVSARVRARRLKGGNARLQLTAVDGFNHAQAILSQRAAQADMIYSWHDWSRPDQAPGFVVEGTILEGASGPGIAKEASLRPGPGFPLMNRASIPLFNAIYRFKLLRQRNTILPLGDMLFPLAGMGIYFRLYGRGFLEHQVLVPHEKWSDYWPRLGRLCGQHRVRPVVSSLKLFSGQRKGIAFSGEGVSLTINLVNGRRSREMLNAVDLLDCEMGAIANPIKDSRLGAESFRRQTPALTAFLAQRKAFDPTGQFRSSLSERLGL